MTDPIPQAPLPPQGKTRLLTGPSPMVLTANVETSARQALARGLAEYIEQLSFTAFGGRLLRFKRTLATYAESEQAPAAYPACLISTNGPGSYEARSLTPVLDPACRLPAPDNRYVLAFADFATTMSVEVWSTDPIERDGLAQMLEQAFLPVTYRYGFVLELPHYFNERATFELKDMSFSDTEEDATRRYRKATFNLAAVVPLVRLAAFPDAKPAFELAAIGPELSVLLTLEVT